MSNVEIKILEYIDVRHFKTEELAVVFVEIYYPQDRKTYFESYKAARPKNSTGDQFYVNKVKVKVNNTGDSKIDYKEAYGSDSRFDCEKAERLVRDAVNQHINPSKTHQISNTVHQNGFNDPLPPSGRINVPVSNLEEQQLPF